MRTARVIATGIGSAVAIAVAGFGSSTVALAQGPGPLDTEADAGAAALPACVSFSTEARYIPYGYNHFVVLKNGCSKAATCSVATDVNPQVTSVEVASAASVDVLTFRASPVRSFHARVTCKLH
jgi:hypothetical protein